MRTPEKTCTGKMQFQTRAKARRGRNQSKAYGVNKLHIYLCPFCNWYHLGHIPKAVGNGTYDTAKWTQQ